MGKRRRWVLGAVMVVALVGGACGGGSSSASKGDQGATTTTQAPEALATDDELEAAALQAGDLPEGFEQIPQEELMPGDDGGSDGDGSGADALAGMKVCGADLAEMTERAGQGSTGHHVAGFMRQTEERLEP